jgi:hypothetical protein
MWFIVQTGQSSSNPSEPDPSSAGASNGETETGDGSTVCQELRKLANDVVLVRQHLSQREPKTPAGIRLDKVNLDFNEIFNQLNSYEFKHLIPGWSKWVRENNLGGEQSQPPGKF